MDKKSKILIWVFGFLVLISLAFTFYKTVILQDFEVIDTSEYAQDEESVEEDIEESSDSVVDVQVDGEGVQEEDNSL